MRLGLVGLLFAGLGSAPSLPQPGLTIETRRTSSDFVVFTTTYVSEDRSREEFRQVLGGNPATGATDLAAHIIRCDLQKAIALSYSDRSYMSGRLDVAAVQSFSLFGPAPVRPVPEDPPQLVIETETVQTGERRNAFGHTARRVITTERRIPLDAAAGEPSEVVTEGWYIDLETRPSCQRMHAEARLVATVVREGDAPVRPRVRYREIGAPERGYAIEERRTYRASSAGPDSLPEPESHLLVTRLAYGPLDPALFEVPPGFRNAGGALAVLAERIGSAWMWVRGLFGSTMR